MQVGFRRQCVAFVNEKSRIQVDEVAHIRDQGSKRALDQGEHPQTWDLESAILYAFREFPRSTSEKSFFEMVA